MATLIDRIRAAWFALGGNAGPAGLPPAASIQRGVFGGGDVQSGGGTIATLLQQGQAPSRGTADLISAYRTMPVLRSVVDKIAMSIAMTEWHLYRVRGDERRELKSHALLDLITQFNPSMTGRAAWHLIDTWIELKGEAFAVIERNGSGAPVELWPIPPHWIKKTPSSSKPVFEVDNGDYKRDVPADDMLWLRTHDPLNPYGRGVGLAEALADELDTDEYASRHTKSWFYNRAVPDILVGVKGANESQLKRAKQAFEDQNRGSARAHRSHWHSGEMTVEQLSQTFSDMQLVSLREFERNMITQTFGVPPEVLGIIENSNRATIESSSFIFALWVLVPRLEFIKSELNFRLVPMFGSDLVLDYESPVPADRQHALEVLKAAPHAFSVDEIREMAEHEELGDDNGGDVHTLDVSTIVVESLEPGAGDGSARARRTTSSEDDDDVGDQRRDYTKATKALTPSEVGMVADALEPIILTSLVDPEVEEMVKTLGGAAMAEVGAVAAFNMLSPIVIEHIVIRSALLVTGVNETTKQAIRDALFDGLLLGEGTDALARRIRDTMSEASTLRARTIARTEVNASANFARWQGMSQSGVVMARRWLSARDSRVRDAHRFLNNKVAGIGESFNVGGYSAMHPGGFNVARLDVNCRCTTIPVIEPLPSDEERAAGDVVVKGPFDPDADIDTLDDYVDSIFAELAIWEERIASAVREAFAQQERAAIERLTRLAR